MKRLSLITCGLVLSSSFVFANEVKTFDDAFKSGKASGSLGLYGQSIEKDKVTAPDKKECIRRNNSDSQPIYIRTLCRS